MASPQFNSDAAQQQYDTQVFGPIIAGLMTGAPDCWPKINRAVNAIRIAATRAVTRAWGVVDQREATIHQLTNQINNQLLPRQYQLTSQVQQLTNQVQQLRAQLAQNQARCNQEVTSCQAQGRQAVQQCERTRQQQVSVITRNSNMAIHQLRQQVSQLTNRLLPLTESASALQKEVQHCRTCMR